ncbi:MAG: SDR family oxidoreductase [Arenicellales bacterium]
MARILIVGCGRLGRPLGNLLANLGHEVVGIRRSPPPGSPDRINWLSMDITKTETFRLLPADFQQIIIILTPASRSPQGYKEIYQQGLKNLLGHFQQCQYSPAYIFVSATSVYAQQQGQWVNETSETLPLSYNGKSLLDAENQVMRFSERALVIRFSGIYGAERTRLIQKLEKPVEIQQTPSVYTNRIHQDDCVGVLQHLAIKQLAGEKLYPVYLATDYDSATKFEMMKWLAAEAGLVAPIPLVAADDAPRNKRCCNKRLVESGYQFKYRGFKDGYRAMLDIE